VRSGSAFELFSRIVSDPQWRFCKISEKFQQTKVAFFLSERGCVKVILPGNPLPYGKKETHIHIQTQGWRKTEEKQERGKQRNRGTAAFQSVPKNHMSAVVSCLNPNETKN
jgi:hypothetical protein